MLHVFCFAHLPLLMNLPDESHVVCLGKGFNPSDHSNTIKITDHYPDLDACHPFLGGSSGSIAIGRLLQSRPDAWKESDKIVLMQYRKFISVAPMGSPSENYPGMFHVSPLEASQIDFQKIFSTYKTEYLYSQPIRVVSCIEQYKSAHSLVDFLRYFSIAVELGVLSPDECIECFKTEVIIPGGIEFGVFPIGVYLKLINMLDQVCTEFLKHNKPQYLDLYNRRSLAFCNERLGSYLLVKHLQANFINSIPAEFSGYMVTISDGNLYVGGLA